MLKIVNQTVMFLIELVMVGSLAYFGYFKGNGPLTKYALAVILPGIAILLWSYWAAPKSVHRLPMPYLAILRLSLFFLASFLLYKCGLVRFALIIAIISAFTQIASFFYEGEE